MTAGVDLRGSAQPRAGVVVAAGASARCVVGERLDSGDLLCELERQLSGFVETYLVSETFSFPQETEESRDQP